MSSSIKLLLKAKRNADELAGSLRLAQQAWARSATTLTGGEWKKRVDMIRDPIVRTQAACIVWWDFFSTRPAFEAWEHLDEYRRTWRPSWPVKVQAIRSALSRIGYPETVATERIAQGIQTESEVQHGEETRQPPDDNDMGKPAEAGGREPIRECDLPEMVREGAEPAQQER